MAPKPKVEVAREHLDKAQEEALSGDQRDAVQWGFASLEAAIDALADGEGIAIEEKLGSGLRPRPSSTSGKCCRATSPACTKN